MSKLLLLYGTLSEELYMRRLDDYNYGYFSSNAPTDSGIDHSASATISVCDSLSSSTSLSSYCAKLHIQERNSVARSASTSVPTLTNYCYGLAWHPATQYINPWTAQVPNKWWFCRCDPIPADNRVIVELYYIDQLLLRLGMTVCDSSTLGSRRYQEGDDVADVTLYQQTIGSLIYSTSLQAYDQISFTVF